MRNLAGRLGGGARSLAYAVGAALWLDLSPLHRFEQADSIIPILVSLQFWTPFYWGQKRYGMLLPWLARPFGTPFSNLLAQNGLSFALGLSVFWLLPWLLRPASRWVTAGLLGAGLLLALTPGPALLGALGVGQPYAASLGLGLGGLALLAARGRWRLAGVPLFALATGLAYWLNPSVGALCAPLVLGRAWLARREGGPKAVPAWEVGLGLGGHLLGTAASVQFLKQNPDGNPYLGTAPPGSWPSGWAELATHLARDLEGGALLLVGAVLAGLLLARRRGDSAAPAAAAVLLLAAAASGVVAGTNAWVAANQYASRYLLASLLFACSAAGLLLEGALAGRWRERAFAAGLAVLLLVRFGPPSASAVRRDLFDQSLETFQLEAASCTRIDGDYWRVWPAVFRLLQLRAELGQSLPVWGVATRSEDTERLWRTAPDQQVPICVLR